MYKHLQGAIYAHLIAQSSRLDSRYGSPSSLSPTPQHTRTFLSVFTSVHNVLMYWIFDHYRRMGNDTDNDRHWSQKS